MALDLFRPWVREWFESAFGGPTPPQSAAWPAIATGSHVLIHAPTGSGKTLAAFLWAVNGLLDPERVTAGRARGSPEGGRPETGVQVLYISPLKALNYDIERNLRRPLTGIVEAAARSGLTLAEVRVAVRTGDTPARERASMTRKPPHILITTPESLYLILGSPQARNVLAAVRTVIVDEIHAVCGTKRGAHLALSLERLERLSPGFQRIGLSATQRPLDEVARFLGGQTRAGQEGLTGDRIGRPGDAAPEGSGHDDAGCVPRPVRIVDSSYPKALELQVLGMPEAEQAAFPGSIWPGLISRVLDDVRRHRTTLVFCNSRMQAERTADRLNAEMAAQDAGHGEAGPASVPGGPPNVFKAHHGSISDSVRRSLEEDLKAGRLPALIGTSSLELGIDIGSVDLVVQVQSPKSVARGLQRVGRSGHLVGETSEGKIYATHHEDLLEAAVVGRGMVERDIEAVRVPRNPLDVLAQQVVASVSVDDWRAGDLFDLCRRAYPYAGLSRASFDSVLRLVAGRYPSRHYRPLRARIYWDETGGLLTALPGSRMHAMVNGGTIVDRGEFAVYLSDGKTRLGELDEEFVWESRAGDVFTLGSQTWRALEIRDDRVIAEAAPGALPRMPFWKGEFPWRPFELSLRLAGFRRELAARLGPHVDRDDDPPELMAWLKREYRLDDAGARQVIGYVRSQLRAMGTISSDRTVIVETYADGVGDLRMVVHSPFGGRVNAGWAIALAGEIADRTGVQPDMQVSDDGIMFRLPEADAPVPAGLAESLEAGAVKERLLRHLDESPLFGALFRQNATRSLLMPASTRGKRTPFWLQRRRAKDLMAIAREYPDFPVTLETYRDCLEEALDLAAIERVLGDIRAGRIQVAHVESKVPSPVARSLNYAFTNVYLYQWDAPRAERVSHLLQLDRAALAALLKDPGFASLLRPEAVDEVVGEASRTAPGFRARSPIELAQLLEEAGDLNLDEARSRCDGDAAGWLAELEERGLVRVFEGPAVPAGPPGVSKAPARDERRWIAASRAEELARLWPARDAAPEPAALKSLARSYVAARGTVTPSELAARYRVPGGLAEQVLGELEEEESLVSGRFFQGRAGLQWADPDLVARIQSRTFAILRREVRPVSPLRYASVVRRRQGVVPTGEHAIPGSIADRARAALHRLRGMRLPLRTWNDVVYPARLGPGYGDAVDAAFRSGEYVWVAAAGEGGHATVAAFPRATGRAYLAAELVNAGEPAGLTSASSRVWEFLRSEGTASSTDLRDAFRDLSLTGLRDALADVVWRGLVTADSWQVLAALGPAPDQSGTSRPEDTLRVTAGFRGQRRWSRNARGEARRTVAHAVREATAAFPLDVRWSAATRFAVLGDRTSDADRAQAQAEALTDRYGVVTRHGLINESSPWPWGLVATQLALLELRGVIRRGYFVSGLPGLQFAESGVVDELRDGPGSEAAPGSIVIVNAADPALALDRALFEAVPDAPVVLSRLSRIPSTWVAFAGDLPVLLAEDDGRRIMADQSARLRDAVREAAGKLRDAVAWRGGRLTVETWNGQPVLGSPGADTLTAAGFRRDYPGMTFDQVQARLGRLHQTRSD